MHRRNRLLIVDEDRFARVTLAAALRARGFDVQVASTAAEALELDDLGAVDLVIVAVTADQPDGIEALSSICVQRKIPSIVLTNTAATRRLVQALDCGVTVFIEKPVDVDGLCASVARALGASRPER